MYLAMSDQLFRNLGFPILNRADLASLIAA
jgi:hypothetical protein